MADEQVTPAGAPPTPPPMTEEELERGRAYWRTNLRFILILLTIWALVSFVAAIILAKPLSDVSFFDLPLSFWFAQQGSMIVFVILIFIYAWRMDKIDEKYDVHE